MEKTYTIKDMEECFNNAKTPLKFGSFEEYKKYLNWGNNHKPTNIKVRIYIPVDKQTDFWYAKLNGMVYNVKQCSSKGEMSDTIGTGKYDPQECYIVIDGEQKSNVILKQDCKLI
jgi:hypothetical protein